ncbi:hypothetical protein YDYSG_32500 [Paenibacillus tyrfis]|uniref:sporulation protein YpjB n=1 Tax=Paenibacillus tyrfis TaxID=1501230 RepID=UPI0024919D2F|nr:sporulation protein YpjB [Paenibacillus tyrfis]GLI07220.1 hypothetical protein YDYSG_32500 [Paenibacillus tyrfis]
MVGKARRWRRFGVWLTLSVSLMLVATGCGEGKSTKETSASKPSAEQVQKIELLGQTAEELYQKAKQGDVPGSLMALQQLSDQIPKIRFEGLTSIEGMNALTRAVTDAKRVFNATSFKPEEGLMAAGKIRLAADALTHPHTPLWLQYDKLLSDDVSLLEKAATDKNRAEVRKGAALLDQHIGLIRPSLLISRSPTDVEKLDSLATFIKLQAQGEGELYRNVLNAVPPIRGLLDKLFLKRETTAYLPYPEQQNPILWIVTIGSVILASLAFAGWRLSQKNGGLVPVRRPDQEKPGS